MTTLTYTDVIITETCCSCHVVFGMTRANRTARLNDKRTFYCPNGHGQGFNGRPTEDQLREQLAAARSLATRERERREAEQRRAAAARGQVTKIKRRVARGVCPCCNRTFANLAAHMEGQHPDFGGES